jgi:hypothetical protein
MLIQLTQHKHNLTLAVNADHMVYVEPVVNTEGERSNVILSNGHSLQVKETVAQIMDMVNFTVIVDEIHMTEATPQAAQDIVPTLGEPAAIVPLTDVPSANNPDAATAELANTAEHVARQDKPGKNRENK